VQDLNSAMYFVKVVVHGSFTAASQALGVPKSTISDKVAELERALGVTLLTRTTRKLKLTDVGEEFFRKAENGISQLQAAGEEASHSQAAPTGVLRITAPAEVSIIESVMSAISEYRRKFPAVALELDFSDRQVDLVAEGYDIAIRAGELPDSSLIAKRIAFGRFVLVASPTYLKQAPKLSHPKDLVRHDCIRFMPQTPSGEWDLQTKKGKTAQVKVSTGISANSFLAIKSLAVMGNGVALLPNMICKQEISEKKLVQVLPDWSTPDDPVHLVYPPQRFSSPKVREMIPLLEKSVRELMAVPVEGNLRPRGEPCIP